jgi:hypothetical protein
MRAHRGGDHLSDKLPAGGRAVYVLSKGSSDPCEGVPAAHDLMVSPERLRTGSSKGITRAFIALGVGARLEMPPIYTY